MRITSTRIQSGLVGLIALCLASVALAAVEVGKPAPEFSAALASGETVKLSDLRGQHVVLEWTNEGCPFVQKHYKGGNMQGLQSSYTAKGVKWLTVFSSKPGAQGHVDAAGAQKFGADYKTASSAMVLDESGDVGRLYGAQTTPHMYVIDPEGTLIYAGAIDSVRSADPADIPGADNYVAAALDEALAGKAVSTPVSKPYGCSIKY